MAKLLVLALVVAACGGDDGDAGPATCTYQDMTYALGDTFPEGDGCNSCSCTDHGVTCTVIFCGPDVDAGVDASPGTCTYNGMTYELGDMFPAEDGCNSCTCTDHGATCTIIFCGPAPD